MRRETRFTGISPATWKRVYERDGGRCVLCGRGGVLQGAHIVPRSKGGLGREMNIVMLCPACHRRYDQTPERKAMDEEIKTYIKRLYPDWDERNMKYRKGME